MYITRYMGVCLNLLCFCQFKFIKFCDWSHSGYEKVHVYQQFHFTTVQVIIYYVLLPVKGTVSDVKNLQITLEIKKHTFNHNAYHFFSKNCIILTENGLYIGFHSVGTGHCFSPQENSPKLGGKIPHFSFNKSY